MRRPIVSGAAALVLAAGAAFADPAGGNGPALRYARPVLASAGWTRLDLPDDVLGACRSGLPDLRLLATDGAEVPYVVEQELGGVPEEQLARDVESVPGKETTAVIDRGLHPPLSGEATVVVDAAEFLKPVTVLASDDGREWKEIARGSIFATPSPSPARMTTIRFAPSARRYWQLRLDDRNGPPVRPRGLLIAPRAHDAPPPREIALDVTRGASEGGTTTYEVKLPGANLAVAALRLAPEGAVFARRVTVLERVVARDEVSRRELGEAEITRGPGGESLAVPLGDLRGPTLEIKIDYGASPPLALPRAVAVLEPRTLLAFVGDAQGPVTLAYGSSTLAAPRYDLAAVLAHGRPESVAVAHLGAPVDHGAKSPIAVPPHGAPVDLAGWKRRAPIDVPAGGGVVYVSLEGLEPGASLRVVDGASREVPYLFERAVHHARQRPTSAVAQSGGLTAVTLSELASPGEIDAVELTATAPDYFSRKVTVVESIRDARGPVGERTLATTTWERRPGAPAAALLVALSSPSQSSIEVRIEDGDNAPLSLGPVTVERALRRIDFVTAAGESLSLLVGNAAARTPSYDLALLEGALLAAPAQEARLEPARDLVPPERGVPRWFWGAVIVAGLAVGGALAKAMGKGAAARPSE